MPRFPIQNNRPYPRAELIQLLTAELRRESGGGQPLIFENRIGTTDDLYVVVVWERWQEVPPTDRASIIQAAYMDALPDIAPQIGVAIGVTMEEGVERGILPHAVVMILSNSSDPNRQQLVAAIKEEGGVQTREGWQLRFPTEDLAKQAYSRLWKKFPGFWALQRDVSPVSS